MPLEVIGEHSIDVVRLSGGWALDAGARDFIFSKGLANRGCKVVALDADPTIQDPKLNNITFAPLALSHEAGVKSFVMSQDPQSRHIGDGGEINVESSTISDLMCYFNIDHWDVVKLDIEGSEYEILQAFPGPIATQISIEFHEHVQPRPSALYDKIFGHLGQWYDVVQHKKEARYCCHENYWDTLLVLKDHA